MNEKEAGKLIDYVSSMCELYENDAEKILSELEDRDTKVDDALERVYSSLEGQAFCNECSNMKLRDERQNEYYCPRCS